MKQGWGLGCRKSGNGEVGMGELVEGMVEWEMGW